MTEITVTLPDGLAREAAQAGLLNPAAMEELLREAMRRRAVISGENSVLLRSQVAIPITESGLSVALPQELPPPFCARVFGARQEADSDLATERLRA